MKHLGLLVVMMCFSWMNVQGGQVMIKGHVQSFAKTNYGNKLFKVQQVDDFITFKKEEIAKGTTGKHGDFEVKFNVKETGIVYLVFGKVERILFVVPGKSYYVDVKGPFEDLDNAYGAFAKDVRPAVITNKYPQEINYLIDTLDYAYSKWLQENPGGRREKKSVDGFIFQLDSVFSYANSPYFKDYLKYKKAELYLFVYKKKRSEYATKYFHQEKNLGKHVQKMQVFNSFFKGNLKHNILIDDSSPFHLAFKKGDVNRCLSLVYDQPTVRRETQELILLKGIYEVYSQNRYSIFKINRMLDNIIDQSPFGLHKKIAKNIKDKVTHLKEGFPAPELDFVSADSSFKLTQIKGKYVYLCFFRTWDENFVKDLELIEIVSTKYKEELHVVCIGVDDDVKKFNEIKGQYEGKWTFLHYGFRNELLQKFNIEDFRIDRYDIASISKYYLIDPDGDLVFSPARSPAQGFHKDFQRIIAQ